MRKADADALSVTLALPQLTALYRTWCGDGPDKAPYWTRVRLGAMRADTLILRPDAGRAEVIWRAVWPWTDEPADRYRAIRVSEEAPDGTADHRDHGMCFRFPDVCLTPAPPAPVPIPYPNIAQLADATGTATHGQCRRQAGGDESQLHTVSSGDEAGSNGGVTSGTTKGEVQIPTAFFDREGQRQRHRPSRRQHHAEQTERGRHRARRAADRAGRGLR